MEKPYEVVSVPASQTAGFTDLTGIHACRRENRNCRDDATFLAVRKAGGVIDAIWEVVDLFEMIPPISVEKVEHFQFDSAVRERICRYIQLRGEGFGFKDTTYRFFVLTKRADLPHCPSVANCLNSRYHTVKNLLLGKT